MIKAREDSAKCLLETIEAFLSKCRNPAVLEYGDEPIPLKENRYSLEIRAGRLGLEVWDDTRSLSRRISGIERSSTGVLECSVERFARKPGRLSLLDLDRPQSARRFVVAGKQHFAEQFRRILCRQFPGWQLSNLSTGSDLQRSFSSIFPRARLQRGNQVIAALACPSPEHEPGLLTYALLWHSHLSSSMAGEAGVQLCLFLPDGAGALSAHRLRWLTTPALRFRLFLFNEHGSAGEVDPDDLGNLETKVTATYRPPSLSKNAKALLERIRHVKGVGVCQEQSGSISISCRGLEFARIEEGGGVWLGLGERREVLARQSDELERFAKELSCLSAAPSGGVPGPAVFPERWFESAVREHLSMINAELRLEPVHRQVLSFAAADRDLIDLLGSTYSGQLVLMELKVTEDIHLPLQALDYWMRVRWHNERRELNHLFPDVELTRAPPKLLLVSPALSFHPSTDTLLRYFDPDILVERVGVNTCWQDELKLVLRLRGSEMPFSQQSGEQLRNF